MAIVQKTTATINSASTITPALTGVTAGNTLALILSCATTSDNTPTDSSGQTWSKAFYFSTSSAATVAVYYLLSANAGTHTVTWTAGASSFVAYALVEIPSCTAVDVISTQGSASNTATTLSTPSITTTNANDAIIAAFSADTGTGSTNAAISDPPSGWTSIYAQQNTSANVGAEFAYKEVSATGAQSATWAFNADTTGSAYCAAAVSFKSAAAAGAALVGAGTTAATGSGAFKPQAKFAGAGSATATGAAGLTVSSGGAALAAAAVATATGSAAFTARPKFIGAGAATATGSASLTVPAGLTVTLKQKWSQQVSVGNPATLITGSNPMTVTAGDTLICVTSGADNNTQPTATDSAGTFTIPTNGRQNASGSDNIWCSIAYQANAAGGSHTITPGAVNAGGGGEIAHWILEVTNMPATASIRGVFFTKAINTSGSWSVSSDTSVQAGDIAFVMGMYENTAPWGTSDISDPPSGWTSLGFSELNATTFTPTTVAYQVVPTSGVAVTANYSTTDPTISEHISIMLVMVPNVGGAALMGAGASAATGSAALTLRAGFASAAVASASGSGAFTPRAVFAGAAASPAAGAGTLSNGVFFAGAGSAAAAGSGALTARAALAGAAAGTAAGAGALTVSVPLAGAGFSGAAGAAALTTGAAGANLAGAAAAGAAGVATLSGGSAGAVLAGSGAAVATGSGALTTRAAMAGGGFSIATAAGVLTIGGAGVSFAANGTASATGAASLTGRPQFAGSGAAAATGRGVLAIASPFVSGNLSVWQVPARKTVARVPARQIVAQATD